EWTMLTIAALRRIGDDAADAEPAADAWPRLRLRIRRWRRKPAVMSPVAGIAMSVAIVAVLVLPIRMSGMGLVDPTVGAMFHSDSPVSATDRAVENAYIVRQRLPGRPPDDPDDAAAYPRTYPDNV